MKAKGLAWLTYLALVFISFTGEIYAEVSEPSLFSIQGSTRSVDNKSQKPSYLKRKSTKSPRSTKSTQTPLNRTACPSDDYPDDFVNATIASPNSTFKGAFNCDGDHDMFRLTLQNAGTLKLTFPAKGGFYFYDDVHEMTSLDDGQWFESSTDVISFNLSAGRYYF
jgi:hypothetical protein